jgi:hypothetical protein
VRVCIVCVCNSLTHTILSLSLTLSLSLSLSLTHTHTTGMAVDGAFEGLKHTGTVVSRAPEMAADGLNTAFRHEHKMDYTDPRNV